MQPSVRNAIARIDVLQRGVCASRGTGFLVADGLVLTALHVVADRTQQSLTPYPGDIVLTFLSGSTKATIDDQFWDRTADWVLLRCQSPADIRPLPLAELREDGLYWETFGYPDANPRDGMVNTGEVSNHLGRLEGIPVFQLFSREAAAGQGEPVKGLSGSPVIVQNAVVGLLRFALMKDGQTVAGTVYACPMASVLQKAGNLLPLPDPCFGLPGLPRQPLPAEPFRHLAWFTAKEAEVFFGRNREIRQMYARLTAEDAPPILLLYGQTGVGKSSFLDAGLLPRLRWYHQVCYLRRDARAPLLDTLRQALNLLGGEAAESAPDTAAAWRAVEQNGAKPLVVIFDQVEEVYTHPRPTQELPEFLHEIGRLFAAPNAPGKLVLSFRKEWFPEIQNQMESNGFSYAKVFLEGIGRDAIMEAISGLTLTERLRQFYNLTIDPGLPEQIAADLLADPDSPIAPALQILLTKMWRKATAQSRSAPVMTAAEYRALKQEGLLLGDFLEQQLAALQATHAEWVESGLALDVLACHTTNLLSARECTLDDLLALYKHRAADIPALLHDLEDLFLLTDASSDDSRRATRLCHDTLAPLVRQQYATSEHPGQHARRIVESRVEDWVEGSQSGLFDDGSLEAVEHGAAGMRQLTPQEQKLVQASRAAQQARRRARRLQKIVAAAGLLLIMTIGIDAVIQSIRIAGQQKAAQLSLAVDESGRLMDSDPAQSLMLAIAAVGRSREMQQGHLTEQARQNLALAIEHDREEGWAPQLNPSHTVAVAFSPAGIVATGGEAIRLWNLSGAAVPGAFQVPEKSLPIHSLSFSPDGKLLAAVGRDPAIRVWDLHGNPQGSPFAAAPGEGPLAIAFSPAGDRIVSLSNAGALTAWNLTGRQLWTLSISSGRYGWETGQSFNSKLAVARTPEGRDLIVAPGPPGTVGVWDMDGKAVRPPFHAADQVDGVAAAPTDTGQFRIAVYGRDKGPQEEGLVRIWALRGDEPLFTAAYPHAEVVDLQARAGGDLYAVALDDFSVHFVGLRGSEVFPTVYSRDRGRCGVAFDPAAPHLALRSIMGAVQILDLGTGLTQALERTPNILGALAFSPKGDLLAAGSKVGSLHFWSVQAGGFGALRATDPLPAATGSETANQVAALAFDSAGQRLAAGHQNGVIRVWNTADPQNPAAQPPLALQPPQPVDTTYYGLRFSTDGQTLWSATSSGVWSWNLQTGQETQILQNQTTAPQAGAKDPPLGPHPNRWGLALSPDGSSVASAWTSDNHVRLWDLKGNQIGPPLPFSDLLQSLAFTPDGKRLITTEVRGNLNLWPLVGGKFASSSPSPLNPKPIADSFGVNDGGRIAVSPDGGVLFTSGRSVSMWSIASGERIATFPDLLGGSSSAVSLALSPDGTLLAGSEAAVVHIWRATWPQWLAVACDRIRNHPVLTQKTTDSVQLENLKYAKDTCQELVWSKEH